MKSKSLYLIEPGKVEVMERDIQIKPTEVLVKTAYSSICGTDRNHFMGYMQRGFPHTRPTSGHPCPGLATPAVIRCC